MKLEILAIAAVGLTFIILEAVRTGFSRKPGQTRADGWVEALSTLALLLVTQPLAVAGGAGLAALVAPGAYGALDGLAWYWGAALFLVLDDMTQYWWHRASHTVPWLYRLHRPHHEMAYMSIRIVYRNNLFYYLLMPGLWLSGVLIYLGLGWVYAGYIVVKMTVIYAAHSDVRWDAPLYRHPLTARLMWLVERVISTPHTHTAHHGKHASDGVTHYHGNYGNLLFFWDVLFGTARITRALPDAIGTEGLAETSAAEQLLWPVIRTRPAPAAQPAE